MVRNLQEILKEICFLAAIFEFDIRPKHLEAANNRIADHLSRWHFDRRHEQSLWGLTSEFNLVEKNPVERRHFKLLNDWHFFGFFSEEELRSLKQDLKSSNKVAYFFSRGFGLLVLVFVCLFPIRRKSNLVPTIKDDL